MTRRLNHHRRRRKIHRQASQRRPPLRLTPYAWAKLLYHRDLGETEVGGFGVAPAGELLLVEDVRLVRQQCSPVTVKFDDGAVADFFDEQVDQGRLPAQFARIWIHTHPGDCPLPSHTDEETFARCFGSSDWAVMFIVARGGRTYARLRFGAGPGGEIVLPVEVDFQQPFPASNELAWDKEYLAAVQLDLPPPAPKRVADPLEAEWAERWGRDDPFWEDAPYHSSLEMFDERLG